MEVCQNVQILVGILVVVKPVPGIGGMDMELGSSEASFFARFVITPLLLLLLLTLFDEEEEDSTTPLLFKLFAPNLNLKKRDG